LLTANLLKIATRNKTVITNEYYRFDSKGLLINMSDTSSSLVSATTYAYDEKEQSVSQNTVTDAGCKHLYE
jgi:hypothetical protein